MTKIEIRHIRSGDEKDLAYIQTESWKAAFAGILSPEALEKATDIAAVEARYARALKSDPLTGVLLTVDEQPHCMAIWGKCRGDICPESAELICIHSLQDNWGKGLGSLVMERVMADMKADGYGEAVLWVFEENLRARRFYEKCEFNLTKERKKVREAVEVMYHRVL